MGYQQRINDALIELRAAIEAEARASIADEIEAHRDVVADGIVDDELWLALNETARIARGE